MAKQKQTQTQKQDRPIPQTRETEELACDLTQAELLDRAAKLTKLMDGVEAIEREKKVVADDFKARLEEATSEVAKMKRVVQSKRELRDVECVTVHDPYRAVHETTRLDTGEVIRTTVMSREEVAKLLQVELPLTSRRLDEETLLGSNDDGAR